jgi:hypothetical protein
MIASVLMAGCGAGGGDEAEAPRAPVSAAAASRVAIGPDAERLDATKQVRQGTDGARDRLTIATGARDRAENGAAARRGASRTAWD